MKPILKIKLLTIAMVWLIVIPGYSQQKLEEIPRKFQRPTENVDLSIPAPNAARQTGTQWYVFSDRENNPVYSDQKLTKEMGKLRFAQKIAVLESFPNQNNVLRVGLLDKNNQIQQRGFVSANNVLLWKKSLVDIEYDIDLRAMIIFTLSKESVKDSGKVRYYQSPQVNDKSPFSLRGGIFEYFFIYKKFGNYYLIGKRNSIDKEADDILIGWVNTENVSRWNHRVLWEINWDAEAVAERNSFQDKRGIIVTSSQNEANCLKEIDRKHTDSKMCVNNTAVFIEGPNAKLQRSPGLQRRFPLLELPQGDISDQAIKVGVFSTYQAPDIGSIDPNQINKFIDGIDKIRKINIVFVIDASESMQPYTQSVRSGVRLAMRKIADSIHIKSNSVDKTNQYSFGAVLYRDAVSQVPVEKFGQQLTMDTIGLFKWLETRMKIENNKSLPGKNQVNNQEKALFYGLHYAIDQYQPDATCSNYVILIGNEGDQLDSVKQPGVYKRIDDVAKLYKKFNINFSAFQVKNEGKELNRMFVDQMRQFASFIQGINTPIPASTKNPNFYQEPQGAILKTRIQTCSVGKPLYTDDLASWIVQNISFIEDDVNHKVKSVMAILKGTGVDEAYGTASILSYLLSDGFSYSEAKALCDNGLTQDYREGYAFLNSPGCKYPLFKPVVMIERNRLLEFIRFLQGLAEARRFPITERNHYLINVLKAIYRIYFPGISDAAIENIELGSFINRISGKKFSNPELSTLTVEKVRSLTSRQESEINELSDYITSYLANLERIEYMANQYPGRYLVPDSKLFYLFIPADELP